MNGDPAKLTASDIEAVISVTVEPNPPEDFTDFWLNTLSELNQVPLDLQITPAQVDGVPAEVETFVWTASSLGGRRVSGPLTRPAGTTDGLPQWVYGHGYGSVQGGAGWRQDLAKRGFIAVGIDARGYNRSRQEDDPGVPGWVLHGIESPREYILRGAVADTIRAVQVARALQGADPSRTVLSGGSFSGGLAVLAAPWIDDLNYVATSVPTFGAYGLRRTLVERGSGQEVNELLDRLSPEEAGRIVSNLRYFDAVNAAPFIKGPISVGLGVVDVVVPGETVAAIYHALRTPDKELLHYPCSHSAHPLAQEWRAWEQHIVDRACSIVGIS